MTSKRIFPLSPMQQGMYFHEMMSEEENAYYNQVRFEIIGKISVPIFRKSVQKLVDGHESLRTRYFLDENGDPELEIMNHRDQDVIYSDLTGMTEKEWREKIEETAKENRCRARDLENGDLMDIFLFRISDEFFAVLWGCHHIALDGWCMSILVKELFELYKKIENGDDPGLKEVPYSGYLEWLQERDTEKSKKYWKDYLEDVPEAFEFPMRPDKKADTRERESYRLTIDNKRLDKLRTLAAESHLTLSTVIQGIWGLLLCKYSNSDSAVWGCVTSGRSVPVEGAKDMIGLFINTMPVIEKLDSSEALLPQLTKLGMDIFRAELNSDVRINDIASGSEVLFNHILAFENLDFSDLLDGAEIEGFKLENPSFYDRTNYDLAVKVQPGKNLTVDFEYNPSVYDEISIKEAADAYEYLIEQLLNDAQKSVADYHLLRPEKESAQISALNVNYKEESDIHLVQDIFTETVSVYSKKAALVYEDEEISYERFYESALKCAAYLEEAGLKQGELVGIPAEGTAENIINMFGILLAGGGYLPIDESYPEKRIAYYAEIGDLKIAFTDNQKKYPENVVTISEREGIDYGEAQIFVKPDYTPDDTVYVMFTSGSTGTPKGVRVSNSALCRFGEEKDASFAGRDSDRVAQIATLAFDASVYEIFSTLLTGGTLVFSGHENRKDAASLIRYFNDREINRIFLTTQLFQLVIDEDAAAFGSARVVLTGGERASAAHFEKAANASPDTKIVNVYGPTEIISLSSGYWRKPGNLDTADIPIGKPEGHKLYYILDKDMHLMPQGMPGELYIGGAIASGYYKNEKLTEEKFMNDPFLSGDIIYQTGDICLLDRNNDVVYVKRNDEQVKIRGFRIETGEIEDVLAKCRGVKESCVKITKNDSGIWRIDAYYVSDTILSSEKIKEEMESMLPSYMIPSGFLQLKELPLTKNGKLDRKALPVISNEESVKIVLPENDTQKTILGIWQQVLQDPDLGIRHNFFDAGGDSIKAMQIIGLMQKQGLNAEIKMLFEHPTIEKFEKYVYTGDMESQDPVTGEVPLIPIQKWFFDSGFADQQHFDQSVLLKCRKTISKEMLVHALNRLCEQHDALRMIYEERDGRIVQTDRFVGADCFNVTEAEYDGNMMPEKWLEEKCETVQKDMDLWKGHLIHAGLFCVNEEQYLMLAIHHLIVDGVSFRIILRDLTEIITAFDEGKEAVLIPKTVSLKKYAEAMAAGNDDAEKAVSEWETADISRFERLTAKTGCRIADRSTELISVSKNKWKGMIEFRKAERGRDISDVLLGLTACGIGKAFGKKDIAIDVEHNGRGFNDNAYDMTNTVGWFTSVYPLTFDIEDEDIEKVIRRTAELQKKCRHVSAEYMLCKVEHPERSGIYEMRPDICFNYLGDFDSINEEDGPFEIVAENIGKNRSDRQITQYMLEFNALSINESLQIQIDYDDSVISAEQIGELCRIINEEIDELGQLADEKLYEPFGLSQLQTAYFIGKQDFYELGGFTTHNYIEFETRVDIPRLNRALQKIIEQQDMLHTVILPNGTQHVLREVPQYTIKIEDLRSLTKEEQKERIEERRRKLSHAFFDIQKFPLFEIDGFQLDDELKYLFISYDLIMLDSGSVHLMVQDLAKCYYHPELELEPLTYHYRDYIHDLDYMMTQPIYQEAKAYWASKLDDFPEAPQLPMVMNPEEVVKGHFVRRRHVFSKEQFKILKQQAAGHGMTISALLLSAYAHTLNFFSGMDQFAINLTLFNRPNFDPGIERIYGDFSATILLDFDMAEGLPFWKESEAVQETLGKALEYRIYDGIRFSRDVMKKFHYPKTKAVMPIVFTSLLWEKDIWDEVQSLGEMKWSIGQTPQVYIDFQVLTEGPDLCIHMDCVSELFDPDYLDAFFEAFCGILDQVWQKAEVKRLAVSDSESTVRAEYNDTNDDDLPEETLSELFKRTADRFPEKTAVICGDKELSYSELDVYSDRVAACLAKDGLKGRAVGVIADKDEGSIINILGILKAGAYYVPMLREYPEERVDYICKNSDIERILYPDDYMDMPETAEDLELQGSDPWDPAYVLYTSGSTGTPKGVMVMNKPVANIAYSGAELFGVNDEDVVIGLSSLCFDMSVLDLFVGFSAGCTLVMVQDVHEIEKVAELVEKHKVTFWNSVPALMQMYMTIRKPGQGKSIRHISLGGDFIPKQLAQGILTELPNAELFSIGGPTETSVFDIYYPVRKVENEWDSIPYGSPLKNNQIYVMDSNGRELPNGVRGEICAGGMGVEKGGYVNQPDLMKTKYFEHPEYGRIFRTGDYGKFHKEGYVEICGRMDGMVKVQGFRIELGEIENVLLKHPGVRLAAALIHESDNGSKSIMAFAETSEDDVSEQDLKEYAASYLPPYMQPNVIRIIDEMPLNQNNKINRLALQAYIEEHDTVETKKKVPPRNDVERQLLEVWKQVLGIDEAGVEDDFFESGGDSLKAMEFLSEIKKSMDWDGLLLTDILKHGTIRQLADFKISGGKSDLIREMTDIREGLPKIYFIHGGNGSADSYRDMIDILAPKYNCYGIDYIRGITLEPQKISLKELAREYAEAIMMQIKPSEEIRLVGWCIGGTIAFETAYVLENKGYSNIRLVFLDTQEPGRQNPYEYTVEGERDFMKEHAFDVDVSEFYECGTTRELWEKAADMIEKDHDLEARVKKKFAAETAGILMNTENLSAREVIMLNNFFRSTVDDANKAAVSGVLQFTNAIYIHAGNNSVAEYPENWQRYLKKPMEVINTKGTHFSVLEDEAEYCAEKIG